MTELTEKEPTDIKLYELLRSIVMDAGGCQSQKLRGICCAPDEYCSCACNAYDRIVASGYAIVPLDPEPKFLEDIGPMEGFDCDAYEEDIDRPHMEWLKEAIKALTEK